MKDTIIKTIQVAIRQVESNRFDGLLARAAGCKDYVEGYIRCAEDAGILSTAEALAFRQKVQRVARGETSSPRYSPPRS